MSVDEGFQVLFILAVEPSFYEHDQEIALHRCGRWLLRTNVLCNKGFTEPETLNTQPAQPDKTFIPRHL